MKVSKVSLITKNVKSWKINFATKLLIAIAAFTKIIAITIASTLEIIKAVYIALGITTLPRINPNLEHIIANEITIYNTPNIVN